MTNIKSFDVGNVIFGDGSLSFILGPCVVESSQHALFMAQEIHDICKSVGVDFVYKSSFDKANRSSIESFGGIRPQKEKERRQRRRRNTNTVGGMQPRLRQRQPALRCNGLRPQIWEEVRSDRKKETVVGQCKLCESWRVSERMVIVRILDEKIAASKRGHQKTCGVVISIACRKSSEEKKLLRQLRIWG